MGTQSQPNTATTGASGFSFGNTQQNSSTNLFGNTASTQGNSIFGATSSQPIKQAGSLFGNTTSNSNGLLCYSVLNSISSNFWPKCYFGTTKYSRIYSQFVFWGGK